MIEMTLANAAKILDIVPSSEKTFHGLSIDTRTLSANNLFIAIRGDRLDGHDYLELAYKKGAAAAIVSRKIDSPLTQLIVKDTTQALGQLGAHWRDQFDIPIIAVTGSNGKTTLKNLIALIMLAACKGDKSKVLATQGTLNNQWGLPLTLSLLNKDQCYTVIEMGMNHFGEIEYLTKMTKPKVAVITNAAASHLEGLGDVAGVARAKAEIFSGLPYNGVAVLNRDDAFFPFWHELIGNYSLMTFGFHPDADIRATIHHAAETQQITIHTPNGDITVNFPLMGTHNVQNALAATAATLVIGIDLNAIQLGLEMAQPAPGRLELHTLKNGVQVIDDTYNANPFSVQAALNILSTCQGKKIFVLGDMNELGVEAKMIHQAVGESIHKAGIDYLFTFGKISENAALAFGEGAQHFNEQKELIKALKFFLYDNTTILIKGSRSMHMENVVKEVLTDASVAKDPVNPR